MRSYKKVRGEGGKKEHLFCWGKKGRGKSLQKDCPQVDWAWGRGNAKI